MTEGRGLVACPGPLGTHGSRLPRRGWVSRRPHCRSGERGPDTRVSVLQDYVPRREPVLRYCCLSPPRAVLLAGGSQVPGRCRVLSLQPSSLWKGGHGRCRGDGLALSITGPGLEPALSPSRCVFPQVEGDAAASQVVPDVTTVAVEETASMVSKRDRPADKYV